MPRHPVEPRPAAMSARQFGAWMRRHELSYTTAAKALGISRRQVAHFIAGTKAITRLYWLATKGYTADSEQG